MKHRELLVFSCYCNKIILIVLLVEMLLLLLSELEKKLLLLYRAEFLERGAISWKKKYKGGRNFSRVNQTFN